MVSKEKTMEILERFSQECYNYWMREGNSHKKAFELMLKDIECTIHDPYDPYGDELNMDAKEEFLKNERSK